MTEVCGSAAPVVNRMRNETVGTPRRCAMVCLCSDGYMTVTRLVFTRERVVGRIAAARSCVARAPGMLRQTCFALGSLSRCSFLVPRRMRSMLRIGGRPSIRELRWTSLWVM